MARILIVDDDPTTLVLVEHALNKAKHDVVTCSDPTQVVRLATQHGADAVVLDVMMPGVSGYEVLHGLRSVPELGGIPILFLSARSDSQDRVRGLREGADDYLIKPFEPEELVLRVERLVAQRPEESLGDPFELERNLVDRQVVGQLYLGRYKALEVVGEGAMGLVFRGWDPRLKRPVALKTLRFERLTQSDKRQSLVAQLLDEAVTVARVPHPNIVAVYDVGHNAETAFIAMEYVHGVSLATLLQDRRPLPADQVIALGLAVARALGGAHAHEILHHDVKPGNVLLGFDGSIKVTDFGVAQLRTNLARRQEKVFGTPGYLPPETLANKGYTEGGDLFGLGAILYLALTGRHAITGNKIHQVVLNTLKGTISPPSNLVDNVPDALEDLILDLMAKSPDDRVGSAAEAVARFEAIAPKDLAWTAPTGGPETLLDPATDRSMELSPIEPTVPLGRLSSETRDKPSGD